MSANITSVNEAAQNTGRSAAQMLEASTDLARQGDTLRVEVTKFLEEVRQM